MWPKVRQPPTTLSVVSAFVMFRFELFPLIFKTRVVGFCIGLTDGLAVQRIHDLPEGSSRFRVAPVGLFKFRADRIRQRTHPWNGSGTSLPPSCFLRQYLVVRQHNGTNLCNFLRLQWCDDSQNGGIQSSKTFSVADLA